MISYNIPMAKLPILLVISFLQLSSLFLSVEKVAAADVQANIPPRGWNSYDSYSWIISEEQFLQNAQIASQKLLQHGYEFVVVDYLWYRKIEHGSSQSSPGFDNIDEWGRPIPDPKRWQSSQGGKGFKEVADIVHKMGLKFGIHVMAGISTQAVNANTPIMGSQGVPYVEGGKTWYAKDIGLTNQTCSWMPACFMSVQANLGAGRAFLKSLYTQYAEWGVDFVKHDCVFGDNLNVEEIKTVSQILQELDHPIVYSLSPGKDATPQMAMQINSFVNMYRITNDDWDNWSDVQFHFNVSRDFAKSNLIGANGLRGKSWPDLDMLPIGWLTDPGVKDGPHRFSNLTLDEQKNQLTLWGMTKSPLMFGGDLLRLQDETLALITNPTLLSINSYSTNNQEVRDIITYKRQAYSGPNSIESFNNDTKMASKLILSVSSCKEKTTKKWRFDFNKEETNRVCWKGQLGRDNAVCFYHAPTSDQNSTKMEQRKEYQILASSRAKLCLDSSPKQFYSSQKFQSHYFSPCMEHTSQKWRLRADGSLYNDYTHLCASLAQVKDKIEVHEVRIWAANGPKGENYFAVFNLSPVSSSISIGLNDVIKGFQKIDTEFESKGRSNCTYTEIWSGQMLQVKHRASGSSMLVCLKAVFEFQDFNRCFVAMTGHSWKNISLLLLMALSLLFFLVQGQGAEQAVHASIPPRGWNSYDSFSWTITEEQFLDNARVVSHKLLQHGYQYVVVDYLWYRKFEPGAYTDSLGFDVIDEWGRPIPDPKRWPSSKGGQGFKSVAEIVHKMGLKFGIHVMRGISTQAFSANTPIMGSNGLPYQENGRIWRARDIGLKNEACKWMSRGFMSVDTRLGASQAFLKSLYQQYAEWGVDFVKHDCVFGDDFNINEITTVSQILKDIERPILYSISPGTHVTVNMAKEVSALVNMYRVTGDDWDTWMDVQSHFNVSRNFAKRGLIGGPGLLGKSWPDLDMLPFGRLSSVGANEGPYRTSKLTFNEQKAQMALWAMAKSPLMFGGDLRNIDIKTMEIITNPTILNINAYSTKNMEVQVLEGYDARAWIANGSKKGQTYISFFNLSPVTSRISVAVKDMIKVLSKINVKVENEDMNPHSLSTKRCAYYDAWSGQGLGILRDKISEEVPSHGCALFVIQCA